MTQDLPVNYLLPDETNKARGLELIKQGKVCAIALAGGHGSRLGYDAPKGCFPITKDGKSLYQLLAEKVPPECFLGIMTSDATHEKTVEHFEKANFFGLDKVFFFKQGNLPLQDEEGNVLSAEAPNGNGAIFWHLQASGYLELLQDVEQITLFPIDNALADPFQPNLVGVTSLHNNDVTVVAVARENQEEQVGVLVQRDKKLKVIEYSEGSLDYEKYPLANISYFSFSLPFINQILKHPLTDLPLHKAKKKIPPNDAFFYKSEYFIFDLLDYAEKAEVLLLERNKYFAPLKNKTGPQSIVTVQAVLKKR